jgi:hypothetical protein
MGVIGKERDILAVFEGPPRNSSLKKYAAPVIDFSLEATPKA